MRFTPAPSARSTMTRASRSSTVVIGGMPEPNVIAPSARTDTSSPLAPSRRRSTAQSAGVIAVASSAPSGPITRRNTTGTSGAMVREPSAMAVQWNGNRIAAPVTSTSPRPAWSSNAETRPVYLAFTSAPPRAGPSRHDLGDRELDDAVGAVVEQLGDQRVDLALGDDGLDREAVLAEELRHRGRLQGREQRDHAVEVGAVDVELQQHPTARLERAGEQALELLHRLALLRIGVGGGAGDELGVRHEHRVEDAQAGGAQGPAGLGDLHHCVGDLRDLRLGGAVGELHVGLHTVLGEVAV